jgi:CheY-like chemotaxis protein
VVLIVGGDDDNRRMYAEYLSRVGLDVLVPASSLDAVAKARSADAIVADVVGSDPSGGLDLVARFRVEHPAKPIVVLTACSLPSERDRAKAAGADLFLTKPCLPDCLVRHLRRVFARDRIQTTPPLHVATGGRCLNPQHRQRESVYLRLPPKAKRARKSAS